MRQVSRRRLCQVFQDNTVGFFERGGMVAVLEKRAD